MSCGHTARVCVRTASPETRIALGNIGTDSRMVYPCAPVNTARRFKHLPLPIGQNYALGFLLIGRQNHCLTGIRESPIFEFKQAFAGSLRCRYRIRASPPPSAHGRGGPASGRSTDACQGNGRHRQSAATRQGRTFLHRVPAGQEVPERQGSATGACWPASCHRSKRRKARRARAQGRRRSTLHHPALQRAAGHAPASVDMARREERGARGASIEHTGGSRAGAAPSLGCRLAWPTLHDAGSGRHGVVGRADRGRARSPRRCAGSSLAGAAASFQLRGQALRHQGAPSGATKARRHLAANTAGWRAGVPRLA